jgi:formylglycine-generating enzyme required for sulfatase activity
MPTSTFAAIPGGWFTMGTDRGQEDERPPHRVFVDSFDLAVFRSRAPNTSAS